MCLKCADTGPVLIPFMLPQVGIISTEVFPILAHVLQQVSTTRVHQDKRYIAVLAFGIAELIEAAGAMIGPGRG